MADQNLSTSLLSGMEIVQQLSEADGVSSYLVRRQLDGREFILKYISIPESQTQIEGLRLTGAVQTDEDAKAYYENVSNQYKAELKALSQLSEVTNIAAFDAHELKEKEDGIGYDLYLISERRQTLEDYLIATPMTQLKAAGLALDLCGALSDLRKVGYLHADVKPSNVLLNANGHFMLSDLGLFKIDQLKYAVYPRRMLGSWSAPELFDMMGTMNETMDIYAVGMVLYNVYNGGHAPFEDERTSAREASEQRKAGLALPVPLYADYEMSEIILKACAFRPEDRYQTPEDLKQALTDYVQRNALNDDLIVPPILTDETTQISAEAMEEEVEPIQFAKKEDLDEEFVEHFSPDTESLNEIVSTIQKELAEEDAKAAEAEQSSAEEEPAAEETPLEAEAEPTETEPEEAPAEEAAEETLEEAPAEQPEETSEEAPAAPQKKKAPFWVWILVGVAALAAAATFLYFRFTPSVTVSEVADVTVDSFTVVTDASSVTAYCVDAYGNRIDGEATEQGFLFTGLTPATQYTVYFRTADGRQTRGTSSLSVTTSDSTEILFFNAKPISESQVELTFNLYGADAESWVVTYEGGSETFSGHSVVISNLAPDTHYTFTLSAENGKTLTGVTAVDYSTTVTVTEVQLSASYDLDTSALTLEWTYAGEAPEDWTITCTDANGAAETQTVTEAAATFSGLTQGDTYTVELYCDGMASAVKRVIRTQGVEISDLKAEAADGGIAVSWTAEPGSEWLISYAPDIKDAIPETLAVSETSALLSGLIPETAYTISVQPSDGSPVIGIHTVTAESPRGSKFASYGCTSTYMGLFLAPAKETMTARDLVTRRDSYTASESIAYAVQALSSLRSSTDEVKTAVVLRNADGKIVCCDQKTAAWNDLWSGDLFFGKVSKTPQEAGRYTLSVYFNGQSVASANLTIK
ncbi:MAG: protein kinase [Oscillospiraceae bacterium]|nr:protein kinase [Oscillospiraceae bacterium]